MTAPRRHRPRARAVRERPWYRRRYGSAATRERARAFQALAIEAGLDLPSLAYAFALQRPGVDVVLAGPASVGHLEAALRATKVAAARRRCRSAST
jgi:aryl-alcohol dehydrogenase-like predicted oxidoreductase